eukprot:TRINITY_DN8503_c0_g1_i1.p1 TRINITY_DN8503_c0_g1~~TRINITY_DN8503_c0_g1_i1.p1  ORF type:complete len:583 (-),score=148.77 TRINITY_DN8503_c0_g1_i1:23-1732(-)
MSDIPIKKQNNIKTYIISVDYGQEYSGYAFGYRRQDTDDPGLSSEPLTFYQLPDLQEFNGPYCKTKTAILYERIDSSIVPIAWGWTAYKKYLEYTENGDQDEYRLLEQYKMEFYDDPSSTIKVFGQDISVKKIMVDYLKMLFEYLKQEFTNSFSTADIKYDVTWVFTVPTICEQYHLDDFSQIIRDAGLLEGIDSGIDSNDIPENDLLFITEAEAASIGLMKHHFEQTQLIEVGDEYLVVDIGGGTVDVTSHEMNDKGVLKQTHVEIGGEYGGNMIDKNFFQYLQQRFPEVEIEEFFELHPEEKFEFTRNWELKKRIIDEGSRPVVTIPYMINQEFKVPRGKIRIEFEDLPEIFSIVDNIEQYIKQALQKIQPKVCFLAGGTSSSKYIQKQLVHRFPDVNFVFFNYGGSMVLRGAVYAGIDTSLVRTRRSKLNVGIECKEEYDPIIHGDSPDPKNAEVDNGIWYIKNIFQPFVRMNDEVVSGEVITKDFDVSDGAKSVEINIYSSPSRKCPTFISDFMVVKMATMEIDVPANSVKNITVETKIGAHMLNFRAFLDDGTEAHVDVVYTAK